MTSAELAAKYMPLVHHVANQVLRRCRRPGLELGDLVSSGVLGLLEAAQRFDGRSRFITFAYRRIHGAMIDWLRADEPWTRSQTRAHHAGREALGVVHEDADSFEADVEPADLAVERGQLARAVRVSLRGLSANERRVLEVHYLLGREFQSAARELGVTKSWISRLHADALEQLRADETLEELS